MAQNDTVKVIGSWSSPFALRARVALHLKSVKYEYLDEPYVLKSKSELLIKSNPIHKKVPVLIHGDVSICESLNIVQYVDEAWPSDPSILPSQPYDRASARFWAQYVDDKCFGSLDAVAGAKDDEGRKAAAGKLMECLGILEETFQKSSKGLGFFGGENIGYIDIACGTLLGPISVIEAFSGVKFLQEETTPGLMKWAERFRTHEAVNPYMPSVEELVAFAKQKFSIQ
ncbi:PREDICTED: LOW QUALITY PROTEIN: glutathione S-transferase U13-like [Camelina sativa]|uniref:Glutathione S-transferase n=1 Tax=Camelina sativa TaxID=90675 RepID=A0ABM0WXZ3_CAMSA|nr:PREDICTED: LOW QUALITY PROTEIN: glutathione S-transferase U13-like [Camelina sativa]